MFVHQTAYEKSNFIYEFTQFSTTWVKEASLTMTITNMERNINLNIITFKDGACFWTFRHITAKLKTKNVEACSVTIIQVHIKNDHTSLINIIQWAETFVYSLTMIELITQEDLCSNIKNTSLFIEDWSNRLIFDRNTDNKHDMFKHVQQTFNSLWQHPSYDPTFSEHCLQSPSVGLRRLSLELEHLTSCNAEIIKL